MLKEGNTAETKNTRRKNEELIITEAAPKKQEFNNLNTRTSVMCELIRFTIHHNSHITAGGMTNVMLTLSIV